MSSFVNQHKGAVLFSVVLHVAIVAALTMGVSWPTTPAAPVATQLAIEAVVVDEAAMNKEIQRREQAERQEVQRRQREERQAREKVETERRQREEAVRKEEQRVADLQLRSQREEAEKLERAESAKREQERVAKERRETEQRQEREREQAELRRREEAAAAKRKAEAEAERTQALAAETARRAAAEADALAQYVLLIQRRIEQAWIAPQSAQPGLDCVVNVVQIPSGDVVDVNLGACNGDEAVKRSIEAAVQRASPLPKPANMALFQRNLRVTFRPDI